ncbi:hypothetical protein ACOSQ2_013519 [Xanthoceras sorbifolium]
MWLGFESWILGFVWGVIFLGFVVLLVRMVEGKSKSWVSGLGLCGICLQLLRVFWFDNFKNTDERGKAGGPESTESVEAAMIDSMGMALMDQKVTGVEANIFVMNGIMVVENKLAANVLEAEGVHNNTTSDMERLEASFSPKKAGGKKWKKIARKGPNLSALSGLQSPIQRILSARMIIKARGRNRSLSPAKKSLICKLKFGSLRKAIEAKQRELWCLLGRLHEDGLRD